MNGVCGCDHMCLVEINMCKGGALEGQLKLPFCHSRQSWESIEEVLLPGDCYLIYGREVTDGDWRSVREFKC